MFILFVMKRSATSVLTKENCDDLDEPEDVGKFTSAQETELKTRVIRTGKRRLVNKPPESSSSPFAGFAGFSVTNVKSKESFSFLSSNASVSNTAYSDDKTNKLTAQVNNKRDTELKGDEILKLEDDNVEDIESPEDMRDSDMECLNTCFYKWVVKSLKDDSTCNLTPGFRDYEVHLRAILNKATEVQGKIKKSDAQCFSSSSGAVDKLVENGGSIVNASTSKPAVFQFSNVNFNSGGMNKSDKDKNNPFSASTTNMFKERDQPLLPANAPPTGEENTNSLSEQADKTAKNETSVAEKSEGYDVACEKDLVYSKRCKIFFKVDDSYQSQGISVILIKLVDGKKYQLIARTDNAIGRVKINCLLNKSIPVRKSGPNNIMLVCSPMPGEPPVPILIKVKTTEDADEVIDELNKCKE